MQESKTSSETAERFWFGCVRCQHLEEFVGNEIRCKCGAMKVKSYYGDSYFKVIGDPYDVVLNDEPTYSCEHKDNIKITEFCELCEGAISE